jgi:hypothetical protein
MPIARLGLKTAKLDVLVRIYASAGAISRAAVAIDTSPPAD